MSRQPSLAELRGRVHKARHREVGNWLARHWGRPAAVPGTWLALRLGLSANQVTLLAIAAIVGSAAGFAWGTRAGFLAGVGLGHLAFWLDHVDGQVARWRGTAELGGVYLDYLMHHLQAAVTGFGLGLGLARATGQLGWTIAGFAAGLGWLFLGLHNDCRYKAFFQRLKADSRSFRVDGGSAEAPAPPAPWPRRGRGLLTWPAFKLCEPHAILLCLTALGVAAACAPGIWRTGWCGYLLVMAVLAPALAAGRVARTVRCQSVARDFDRWFVAREPG
jgi:hypothetical protein